MYQKGWDLWKKPSDYKRIIWGDIAQPGDGGGSAGRGRSPEQEFLSGVGAIQGRQSAHEQAEINRKEWRKFADLNGDGSVSREEDLRARLGGRYQKRGMGVAEQRWDPRGSIEKRYGWLMLVMWCWRLVIPLV